MASRFDRGRGRCLNTGLRVLTKSRKWASAMCRSRKARSGGCLLMSRSSTAIPRCSRKLLALRQVVQVGFQKKVGLDMSSILDEAPRHPAQAKSSAEPVRYNDRGTAVADDQRDFSLDPGGVDPHRA